MSLLACGHVNTTEYQDTDTLTFDSIVKSDLHTNDMELRDITRWVTTHFGTLCGVILSVTDSFWLSVTKLLSF